MATRKRASSRSRIGRAVKAGRTALRQAERRLPPDVRRQLERTIKDGQKRFDEAFKDVRARVTKADGRADIERARKTLENLGKQVQGMVRTFAQGARKAGTSSTRSATRAASSTRRTATRKAASTRKAATRKTTARKTATRKTTTRKASTARRAPTRKPATATSAARKPATRRSAPRRRAASEPTVRYVPPAVQEAPGPMPERVDMPGEG